MRPSAVVRLVRAPAALTVPGDVLAGAAASGRPACPATLVTAASSVCLYWAGMALNDWADRDLDAGERPERPIPSGQISPRAALTVACGLTCAGLCLAAVAEGRRGLLTALPLTGAIWAYDLMLKDTAWGPAGMAATRMLNVLRGAVRGGALQALPAAAVVGAHTHAVTRLSRHEVGGGPRSAPAAALAAGGAIGAGTALAGRRSGLADAELLALAYVCCCAPAQLDAVRSPTAAAVRRAVGAGIHALLPLQGALIARSGSRRAALTVAAGYPLARLLARKAAVT
ncbi:SCO3242 family prenyltransferase [Streptomyces sp. NPDC046887]|uniref:SCO3242 family prenyltransferase n=1 Tax=Streptomyces sp. NPDC046887 TaxID=3155472 RepID=UPI00340D4350